MVTIDPSTGPFEVGDELTCTSDSDWASYSFSGVVGADIDGNTATLTDEGHFSITCSAANDISVPCTGSLTVTGTAYSKEEFNMTAELGNATAVEKVSYQNNGRTELWGRASQKLLGIR